MKTKLIVTDLDGTLLTSAGALPGDFEATLDSLAARGLCFAAASGRQYANMYALFQPFADRLFYIAENGALVYHGSTCLISRCRDGAFFAPALAAVAAIPGVFPVLCGESTAYVEDSDPLFLEHASRYYARLQRVPSLNAVLSLKPFCKVAAFSPDAARIAEPPLRALDTTSGGVFRTVLSGKTWVDLMIPGVDKGRALADLLSHLGLEPAEALVFGDYLNDLPLMRIGAPGVAMANAHPDLKAAAAHTAPSNDADGVRAYLRELHLL